MSKIGRKPIKIDEVKVEIKGNDIHYSGSKASGVYHLPVELSARIDGTELFIIPTRDKDTMTQKQLRNTYRSWGLHHALLANELSVTFWGLSTKVTNQFKTEMRLLSLMVSLMFSLFVPPVIRPSMFVDSADQEPSGKTSILN